MIGVGNMGSRMSRRLADAGWVVHAFDVSRERVRASGAVPAARVADLAAACDVILLSLPDSEVIEAVARGDDGLLSTARPESTRALHAEFAAKGAEFIDAGISGGAAAAADGTLTLMVGGDAAALRRVLPALRTFSARVYHLGPSGSGHVAKVLNNFLNGVTLAATAEVMVAGKKAGLDLARLLDVINNSSGVSFASLNRFPHIIRGDYLEGGLSGRLMAKDLRLYVDLTEQLGVASIVGPAALTAFRVSNALGYGDDISNRVVDAFGDLAGGVRVARQEG
jgi:3-hydroxyisobutyrate dehydrogenase